MANDEQGSDVRARRRGCSGAGRLGITVTTLVAAGAVAISWGTPVAVGESADTTVATLNLKPLVHNRLVAVSALNVDDVWAVGSRQIGDVQRTLTKHWDGSSWATVPSVDPDGQVNQLLGVTALAADDVWAVGSAAVHGVAQPLIEHWDGVSWTQVPSPEGGQLTTELTSIDAVSPTDIWAVGYENMQFGDAEVMIQHWDGASWTRVKNHQASWLRRELTGVTVLSARNVWAVGLGYQDEEAGDSPISLHWDGHTWSQVQIKVDDHFDDNPLLGVDAISRHNIWAVGYNGPGSPPHRTLFERFAGVHWRHVQGPTSVNTTLYGVSAASANDIWAVGSAGDVARPYVVHREGSEWVAVDVPSRGVSALFGVSALSQDDAWAVGTSGSGRFQPALIEHWDGTSWSIVAGR